MDHENEFRHRPHTHVMWHHVESACAVDVQKLCGEPEPLLNPPKSTGDPLLDWIFVPSAPVPAEIRDLTRMMDRMFDPLFMEPSREHITLFWVEEPKQAPHFLIDSATAKVAQGRQPEEIPQLAVDLQKYGNEMLTMYQEGSFPHHMARRLTEMDAATIQHQVHLPFGCHKNRCLRQAHQEGKVSKPCAASIQELETTFVLESELEHRQDLFVGMMWVYIATLCLLLILLARRMRSQRPKRQLRLRILQAVYSNPAIKRQVEDDLGQSVGSVPPVSRYALRLMSSGGKDLKQALRFMKRVHMMIFALLLILVVFAPFWVLPICISISVFRVVELCLYPSQAGDGECECCCCGASTSDAKKGLLTPEQECCSCCKGSGVCAPSCATCCGDKSCCCASCGCCGGGCNCCCKDSIQVVNGCTCCCCGASPSQARDGTLTDVQACCNCCKGTGKCCDACANCCGGGGMKVGAGCKCCCCGMTVEDAEAGFMTEAQACCSCCKGTGKCCDGCADCCGGGGQGVCCEMKGRGQKHVVGARNEIYCGIPLQIV